MPIVHQMRLTLWSRSGEEDDCVDKKQGELDLIVHSMLRHMSQERSQILPIQTVYLPTRTA